MSEIRVDSITDEVGTSSPDFPNGILKSSFPAGSVIQVVQTVKDDVFSSTSTSYVDITGLSASITPTSSSNKIYVSVCISNLVNDADTAQAILLRDSTQIANAASGDNVIFGGYNGGFDDGQTYYGLVPSVVNFLDSPNSTNNLTYKVQAKRVGGSIFYLNRNVEDSGTYDQRGISTITLMEIAG